MRLTDSVNSGAALVVRSLKNLTMVMLRLIHVQYSLSRRRALFTPITSRARDPFFSSGPGLCNATAEGTPLGGGRTGDATRGVAVTHTSLVIGFVIRVIGAI